MQASGWTPFSWKPALLGLILSRKASITEFCFFNTNPRSFDWFTMTVGKGLTNQTVCKAFHKLYYLPFCACLPFRPYPGHITPTADSHTATPSNKLPSLGKMPFLPTTMKKTMCLTVSEILSVTSPGQSRCPCHVVTVLDTFFKAYTGLSGDSLLVSVTTTRS